MTEEKFSITKEELTDLVKKFPYESSSSTGKFAVEIAKLYFKSKFGNPIFTCNNDGIDLSVNTNGVVNNYEIKGTTKESIAWNTLKVSGDRSYDQLKAGMTLIRITKVRTAEMSFYFLKFNEDFELVPEPRWTVKQKIK